MTVAVQKPPSPEIIFETLNAYQRTQALRAAIELDLFSAIGQGKTTSAAIAERITASPKGTRVLCDYHFVSLRVATTTCEGQELTQRALRAERAEQRAPDWRDTVERPVAQHTSAPSALRALCGSF